MRDVLRGGQPLINNRMFGTSIAAPSNRRSACGRTQAFSNHYERRRNELSVENIFGLSRIPLTRCVVE
jgi:hypothetical protein